MVDYLFIAVSINVRNGVTGSLGDPATLKLVDQEDKRTRIYCPKLLSRFPKFGSPFLALTVLALPTPKRGERQYRVLWADVETGGSGRRCHNPEA